MKKHSILILIFILFNFTSCNSLKKSFGSSQDNKSYNETLTAFYPQSSGNRLTLIGKKNNYTFKSAKQVTQLIKNQKLLNLNPSNLTLNIRVKEYKSSTVTLVLSSRFEKSKLNTKQIKWLESNSFSLEQRAVSGGKKSESSRPPLVPVYLLHLNLKGERETSKNYKQAQALSPVISLEVNEYIVR